MIGKLVISQLAHWHPAAIAATPIHLINLGKLGNLGFKLQTSRKFGSKFSCIRGEVGLSTEEQKEKYRQTRNQANGPGIAGQS
jgi:hypothetical protein